MTKGYLIGKFYIGISNECFPSKLSMVYGLNEFGKRYFKIRFKTLMFGIGTI